MKYILPFILLFFTAFNITTANAQQKPKHEFKTYVAPDGKLYIQKELPLYLYLSTKPGGKGEMHQLESDSTKAYANPFYLDTEGYNTVRTPSAVDTVTKEIHFPMHDVVFEMYADSRPPHTRLSYDAEKKYLHSRKLYVGKGLSVDFNSVDEMSGVENIYVSIDSAAYTIFKEPLEFTQQKVYHIQYFAVDHVGNEEEVRSETFYVDLDAPKTEISFNGEKFEDILSGLTTVQLDATDNISGIKGVFYSIDNQPVKQYWSPISCRYLAEGEHSLVYYAEDNVGNRESEHQFTFFIDKTPPILVDEIMGNSFVSQGREYSSGRTKLKLTAVDNKAGVREVQYNINNEGFQLYEKPFYLSAVSGSLSVISYAVDNVGNKSMVSEKSTQNRAAYVDLTGPTLKYDFIGKVFKTRDTMFMNKDTKIKLVGTDGEAGLKSVSYSINEKEEINYTQPFGLEKEDRYLLNIYGYDNVDNSNRISVNLYVDNTGPEIFSRFSILPVSKKTINGQEVDVYSSQAVLFLSATDARVAIDRIYYSINGAPEKMYTGIIDGFKLGLDYSIKVKASDKLGNINESEILFATDNTGPEVFTRFTVPSLGKQMVEGKEVDIYPSHVSIFLSVTNAQVAYDKIYYSINGGPERIYQGIIDGFKNGTTVKMKIKALDRSGNQTQKEEVFVIEP